VLIYRKTDAYDRDRVEALLTEGIDWEGIAHWLNPRDVRQWKRMNQQQNALMLTEAQRQIQEQGGTWASLFDRNSLPNRWPTLSWLILIFLVGLAALPLTLAVFRSLPDRGYILARPLGVLLVAWLSWILTNLTPLSYTRGTISLALGLIALVSVGTLFLPSQRRRVAELWRRRKGFIVVSEGLFLLLFTLFWFIRWGNPDLWHAWMGGEKPMDFAYLNAVIKSTEFPPYDPWFAGGYLNYYYFGQVLVGTLIKLIGIVPSVAYNLVIPTWFAMTAMGAFSVTYNLVSPKAPDPVEKSSGGVGPLKPLLFGLVGAGFVALLGNLGEVHLILLKVSEGVLETFESTIPGLAALVRTLIGSFEVIFGGKALPIAINEWYWNASRAIPAAPLESVITEFPFFTFLYADLHAHLIAMPLAFVSLAFALTLVKGAEQPGTGEGGPWRQVLRTLVPLLLWSLTIGALRTTNTWDVPPHLIVVLGALAISELAQRKRLDWGLVISVSWQFGLVFLLSWWLLYQPFWASYGSFYNSIAVWSGTRTMVWAYLVVHGLFLFGIVSYLCARAIGDRREDPLLHRLDLTIRYWTKRPRLTKAARIARVRGLPVGSVVWIGLGLLVLASLFFLIPGLIPFTQANAELAEAGAYAYRGLALFGLGLPMAVLGLFLLFRPHLSPTERLWVYLVLLGLAMSLGVEVIVIEGDIGRMNTVFKFYLQVWLMWGVTAAAALAWMIPRLRRWQHGRGLWIAVLTVLLLFAALYPPLATQAKINDRFDVNAGPGLDGWDYMKTAHYYDPQPGSGSYDLRWDYEAIRWLLDNVVGSPVILEGHTPEYRWGGRYSINTGLPTVLGWNWHQRQQRAAADEQAVWVRASDIARIYNSLLPYQAEALLRKYNVRYIVVGPLERIYYDTAGLGKFEQMAKTGKLELVFDNGQVVIYEVVGE
jgi:YYY domain-containing protein